ncbi:DnaD domain protein [Bacillaceae bacterium SIJ1]|uniref:DnaD domain-containing protein n=1 Tax=Litoribacterium kuwaitense TaxID=1398745 RepID=UPI0013EA9129|nr:DnaD domain protein [Litoribacterium kuwaitense]NGP46008.1 DnaD domain protein [Litoribacterium kuwaitense]
MNYIKELNAFRDWLLLNELPTSAIALWHSLMLINNMAGWKSRFNASNSLVEQLTSLSKQGIVDARKKLIEKNLIKYEKGKKGQAPVYEMVSLVNSLDLSSDQSTYQSTYQSHTDSLNIPKHKQNKTKYDDEDARENPFSFFEQNFGVLNPFISESINSWCDDLSDEHVIAALKVTLKNGKSHFNYAEAILRDWHSKSLLTIDDVRAYERQKQQKKNQGRRNNVTPFKRASGSQYDNYDLGF